MKTTRLQAVAQEVAGAPPRPIPPAEGTTLPGSASAPAIGRNERRGRRQPSLVDTPHLEQHDREPGDHTLSRRDCTSSDEEGISNTE